MARRRHETQADVRTHVLFGTDGTLTERTRLPYSPRVQRPPPDRQLTAVKAAGVELNERMRGPLMPIGGAEDKFGNRTILRRFTELAGGPAARIAIIPTASAVDDAGQRYKGIFLELGAESADVIFVGDRDDANSDALVSLIEQYHRHLHDWR